MEDWEKRAEDAEGRIAELIKSHNEQVALITSLRRWVSDLQSHAYVNCVYCGYRYGPEKTTPVTMADALKSHVERCPAHPMSQLRLALEEAEASIVTLSEALRLFVKYAPLSGDIALMIRCTQPGGNEAHERANKLIEYYDHLNEAHDKARIALRIDQKERS